FDARRPIEVHHRIPLRRRSGDAHRLQPRARQLEIVRAEPARVRAAGDDARAVPARVAARPVRERPELRTLLRRAQGPPVPRAPGRRRHLRVRAEEAVSAALAARRPSHAFLIVATLAAGLYLDVRTDLAGQTALGLAVWLVLFYVLRGVGGEERRAL